jgi:hypothetical protein
MLAFQSPADRPEEEQQQFVAQVMEEVHAVKAVEVLREFGPMNRDTWYRRRRPVSLCPTSTHRSLVGRFSKPEGA